VPGPTPIGLINERKGDRAAEKATVEQTFRDYVATFWTGDLTKVTTFYNDPMMLMPAARVMTSAEVETWVERVRENGRSRGIADAVLERLEVKMVGDGVALVSFIFKRLTKEGAVVETGAGTYYLRKTDKAGRSPLSTPFLPPTT
jgi:ketosteroid isomerase-like protein